MLLGNYNQWNANPGREVGGVTNVHDTFKPGSMYAFYTPYAATSEDQAKAQELAKSSFNNGYLPPYSWLLAPKAGGVATHGMIKGEATLSLLAAAGLNAEAAISIAASLTATAQLVVSAVAAINVAATMTGTIVGIASAQSVITCGATFTGTLSALANAVAAITAGASASGTPTAIGHAEAIITSDTALSPASLAAAVWNAVAASYNDTDSMGEKLNLAGSGGVDYNALKQAIWEAALTGYETDPDSAAHIVRRIQRALGVDIDNPIVTTTTGITAGDMEIEITGDGETTTTLTRVT